MKYRARRKKCKRKKDCQRLFISCTSQTVGRDRSSTYMNMGYRVAGRLYPCIVKEKQTKEQILPSYKCAAIRMAWKVIAADVVKEGATAPGRQDCPMGVGVEPETTSIAR